MPAPRLDLKLRLTLRVAAVAALCFAAAAAYLLFETDRAARARADWIAEDGSPRIWRCNRVRSTGSRARPFSSLICKGSRPALMAPGLCIAYRAAKRRSRDSLQRLCRARRARRYRRARNSSPISIRGFSMRAANRCIRSASAGRRTARAVASIDPQSLIGQSWRETSRLAVIMACALVGLCVLVYATLANALRPTRRSVPVFSALPPATLSARPATVRSCRAFGGLGNVFNHLAGSLETTLVERNALDATPHRRPGRGAAASGARAA